MQMTRHNPATSYAFIKYVQKAAPGAFNSAMRRLGLGCANCKGGLGDATNPFALSSSDGSISMGATITGSAASDQAAQTVAASPAASGSFMDSIASMLPSVVNAFNSNSCTQVNISRAKQGLPAIDCSSVAPTATVGLTTGTQQLLMFGVIAAAGVAVFSIMRKKRG